MGVGPGDEVATLGWNTIWHFDLYWAVPGVGPPSPQREAGPGGHSLHNKPRRGQGADLPLRLRAAGGEAQTPPKNRPDIHTDHRRARPSHKRPRNRRRDKTRTAKAAPRNQRGRSRRNRLHQRHHRQTKRRLLHPQNTNTTHPHLSANPRQPQRPRQTECAEKPCTLLQLSHVPCPRMLGGGSK